MVIHAILAIRIMTSKGFAITPYEWMAIHPCFDHAFSMGFLLVHCKSKNPSETS